jgi:hypothetical protein
MILSPAIQNMAAATIEASLILPMLAHAVRASRTSAWRRCSARCGSSPSSAASSPPATSRAHRAPSGDCRFPSQTRCVSCWMVCTRAASRLYVSGCS